ncbi:MAG: DNRLRE domain-containing protein, partial [Planctomycetes bacterium]|nr:DNRLRE domain-containing protein [Planctomycetota bacterium]
VGVEHGAVRVTDRADGSVSNLRAGDSTRWPHPLAVAAEADTYVVGAEPSSAHGDESVLQISAEADRTAPQRIAFIRFTVPSAPTRAVLHLRVVAAGDGGHVSLAAGTPWDEHHVNFYHVPAFAYPLAIFGPAAVGDDVAVDISAIIRQAGTVTLAVTSAVGGMSFASRETSDGPTLTITSGASP